MHVLCGCRQKPNDCQLCRFQNGCLVILTMFNCNPPIAHCHPLIWGGGILVDHWSTISSCYLDYGYRTVSYRWCIWWKKNKLLNWFITLGGISIHLACSPNEFSWGCKFAGGMFVLADPRYDPCQKLDHLISDTNVSQDELYFSMSECIIYHENSFEGFS